MYQVFFSLWVYILVGLLGLAIGSFLNCVIWRLEKQETLQGRSYCPHCKHSLAWYDVIPVASFLWLGGLCRYCSKKISWQYPLVEIFTAIIFLVVYQSQVTILDINTVAAIIRLLLLWYVASSLWAILVYDVKYFLIPDLVLLPVIAIVFLYRLSQVLVTHPLSFAAWWPLISYGLAAVLAFGFFLAIYLVSRGKWMGFGDVKLAILLGLLLGLPMIAVGLFLSFLLGSVVGIGLMVFQKKGLQTQLPFAPFLIAGTVLALLVGQPLLHWYLSLSYIS